MEFGQKDAVIDAVERTTEVDRRSSHDVTAVNLTRHPFNSIN
jgi:hypothetical protein